MMPLTAQQHKSDGTSSQEGKKKKKIYIYIYTYINEFKFPSGATLSGHYKPAEVGRLLLGMPGAVVPPPPLPTHPKRLLQKLSLSGCLWRRGGGGGLC